MEIEILHLIEGAQNARGLTVIIDVFRAFSLACYMADKGTSKIIPVGSVDKAFQIKEKNPDYILVGERNNKIIPGFDFGNSPFQIKDFELKGKSVIHTTSAGTQGIENAMQADEIITGSFVNANAIIRYIQKRKPAYISLVCMGYSAKRQTEEDNFCAVYLKNELEGKKTDFEEIKKVIRRTSGVRFFMPDSQEYCPSEDFYMCLDLNKFNFILLSERNEDLTILRKIEII